MSDPVRGGGKDIFEYQAPTPEMVESIKIVRLRCKMVYDELMRFVPPSRERSIAITKLEEVSMWANKAIVFNRVGEERYERPEGFHEAE